MATNARIRLVPVIRLLVMINTPVDGLIVGEKSLSSYSKQEWPAAYSDVGAVRRPFFDSFERRERDQLTSFLFLEPLANRAVLRLLELVERFDFRFGQCPVVDADVVDDSMKEVPQVWPSSDKQ